MAKVMVKRTKRIKLEPTAAQLAIAKPVVEHMQQRVGSGIGHDSRPFAPRRGFYQKQMEAMGLGSNPVGTLTGQMVESIQLRGTRYSKKNLEARLVFSPWGKGSEVLNRPLWWIFHPKKSASAKARALASWAAHPEFQKARANLRKMRTFVGGYRGRPTRAAMGITAGARLRILREMEKARIFTN
jgi:hypothetical protein